MAVSESVFRGPGGYRARFEVGTLEGPENVAPTLQQVFRSFGTFFGLFMLKYIYMCDIVRIITLGIKFSLEGYWNV